MIAHGIKLLQGDDGSLTNDHVRVFYPENTWVDVPGNGAYMALTDGVTSGSEGPVLALLECEKPTETDGPVGVTCFSRVRRIPVSDWPKLLPELNTYIKHSIGRFSTDKEALAVLSTDKDIYVRYYVAGNPNTPEKVLTVLSTDQDAGVRWSVAKNPSTPAKVLAVLSTDQDADVQYWVAQNPSTPAKVLTVLRKFNFDDS